MKNCCIILVACLLFHVAAFAGNRFSARTLLYLAQHKSLALNENKKTEKSLVSFFIKTDSATLAQLSSMGIKVNSRFGSVATVQVPPASVAKMLAMPQLKAASIAEHVTLCNDSARYYSHVGEAHAGTGFTSPFKGKGVIVGVIDVGFDFNHISFRDAQGNTRIKRIYLPDAKDGDAPVVDGDTLPGIEITTPAQIKNYTTDCTTSVHGSHTAGTAAGSYMGNAYAGIAPEADLVLCGMPSEALTDVNIANSLKYIFDYAQRENKPVVVNMSFGSFEGAHDGSSWLCQVFDNLSGPGKICVLAAGNDAQLPICISKTFNSPSDTLSTLLSNLYEGRNLKGGVSMWSLDSTAHAMRVVIVDTRDGSIRYASPFFAHLPSDSTIFSKYFSGKLHIASALESNGKYHSVCEFEDVRFSDRNCALGLQYTSLPGHTIRGWCNSYTRFNSFKLPGWVDGDNSMTISDLATGQNTLSVGAAVSRSVDPTLQGGNLIFETSVTVGDIADYSSFGPDVNGVMRPDIVAPGKSLVSAYNRYNSTMGQSRQWMCSIATVDGVDYPFGINSGTSMATPVVTGAIALWLQANPKLTAADVKRVFRATAQRDAFVAQGNAARWGYGKIDVTAGLRYLTRGHVKWGDVNADGRVDVSDVTCVLRVILNSDARDDYDHRDDIDCNGVTDAIDATRLMNIILED